ncbi:MAG TPA: hypothetical protein DIC64_01000 [Alphaproteobacteria bacterium]|nr:hypothetical protein [Alphaproteobacteria bacterium]
MLKDMKCQLKFLYFIIFFILIAFLLILYMMLTCVNISGFMFMKKFLTYMFIGSLFSFGANAAEPTYIEEVQALGYLAGEGLACKASKYDTFELIARAFLISKARSDDEQASGMEAFNEAKAESFISKIQENMSGCAQIANAFNNQKIFKTVIYGDGTLKMPDGKIIKPRQAYDATLVYQNDPEARDKMIELYTQRHNQIMNDPGYQKALRETQAKDQF